MGGMLSASSGAVQRRSSASPVDSGTLRRLAAAAGALWDAAERRLDAPRIWAAAVLFVFALQGAFIFSHRAWLDEWQALQIALESPTLADLLQSLRYEGHPPLWYLLLRGVALVVPSAWVLAVTAAAIAAATQAMVLFAAPFGRAERIAIALGELMLFEYLTLSRSLNLGVLALVAAMLLWRRRSFWIAMAVLPMCDFLFGILSVALIALKMREDGVSATLGQWRWIALWAVSSVLAAISVIPAHDIATALQPHGLVIDLLEYLERLGVSLIPFQTDEGAIEWNGRLPWHLGVIAGPLFLWLVVQQFRRDTFGRCVMLGMLGVTLAFSLAIYPLQTRHLSLVALLLILLKWRAVVRGGATDGVFRLWLFTGALMGLVTAGIAFVLPFDRAPEAIRLMRAQGLDEQRLVVFPDYNSQSISAQTGWEFERLERYCRQTFVRWDYLTKIKDFDQLEGALRAALAQRGQFVLLTHFPVRVSQDLVREIAYIPAGYDGQPYVLTLVGPNSARIVGTAPACPPTRRPMRDARAW